MPRRKSSNPPDRLRRSSRLSFTSATSPNSTTISRTGARDLNVNNLNMTNTSQQAPRKRGRKRTLLTDDEQENVRPEKNEEKKRRSGEPGLLAGMTTDDEDDVIVCLDTIDRTMADEDEVPTMETEDEDDEVVIVPVEPEFVMKEEVMKAEYRDYSPPRVAGVNDGRVIGRPLDAHTRFQLERKASFVYQWPRHSLLSNNAFGLNSRWIQKRMLDLMLDGEVEGGGENDDAEYVIDGILFMNKEAALINWQGYKYPTWQLRGIVKSKDADYNRRRRILDKALADLQEIEGLSPLDLNRFYPNMMLKQTEKFSQYVTNPGILYLSGLLKREQQINEYIDEFYMEKFKTNGPTILFVDATDFKDSSIPTFKYIAEMEETEKAKEIIGDAIAKTNSCKCGPRCNFRDICCAFKSDSKMAYIKKNTIGNATIKGVTSEADDSDDDVHGRGIEKSYDCVDQYECGDGCLCTPTTCQQRVLQRGHGHTLMIFRHHLKGWTVRAGNDIAKGLFVCEYTGQLMAEEEARRMDKMYHLGLDVRMRENRKIRHLVIDANKKGNEGRFFAHSCEPNLFLFRIFFDIEGRPKRHVGLFASRDIKEGEELTFDYFADVIDFEAFHTKTQLLKFTCKCGSKKCRETAYQKAKRQSMK